MSSGPGMDQRKHKRPLVASRGGHSLLLPMFMTPPLLDWGSPFYPFLSKVTPHVFRWRSLNWE